MLRPFSGNERHIDFAAILRAQLLDPLGAKLLRAVVLVSAGHFLPRLRKRLLSRRNAPIDANDGIPALELEWFADFIRNKNRSNDGRVRSRPW